MLLRTSSIVLAAGLALASCAGHRGVDKSPPVTTRSAKPDKNAQIAGGPTQTPPKKSLWSKLSGFSLANLLPGPGVPVVQVRKKDLKDLPTGRERALAFENNRKHGFWFFGGPVDFKEPTLPQPGSDLDGSLLPPRIP